MVIQHFLKRSRYYCAWAGAIVMLCGAIAGNVHAAPVDEQAEISRLVQAGQLSEAMKRVEGVLMLNPRNAGMRFSKGIILAQQGKSTEAIAVLLKLTEDYPDLPEPYNNLAVLYAANGQYESARIALDKAVANNPAYGMAYENLGDVYTELASQAYERASKLDGSVGAKAKFSALRNGVQSAAPGIAKPAAPPDRSILAAAGDNTAAPPQKAGTDRKAGRKPDVGQAGPAAQANPATIASAPAASAASDAGDSEQAAVLNAVNAWAGAWSARDVKTYLAAYSNDFATPRGLSRETWSAERAERITSKQHISVKVENPKVTLHGDQATVQFRQQFTSDKLRSTDQKTLMLIKRDGVWRIRQEKVG